MNTVSQNSFWDRLAVRLGENPQTANTAVVAIGDGRASFTNQSPVPSIVDRLDRDVLTLAGVRWVVLRPFIPEVLSGSLPRNASWKVTPASIEPILQQIVERTHAAGVKIIGGTITPFVESAAYSQEAEASRQSINRRIRATGIFDALIDFDRIVRDPERPETFSPQYRGNSEWPRPVMADVIDLSIFANANRQ